MPCWDRSSRERPRSRGCCIPWHTSTSPRSSRSRSTGPVPWAWRWSARARGRGTSPSTTPHAGDGLGPLRFLGGARGLGRLRRQDVQLLPRRDEVGHRDVAVSNGNGLVPQRCGLSSPPSVMDDLPQTLKPLDAADPGTRGPVEVVASENRDRSPVQRDLRWGVYVVFRAPQNRQTLLFRIRPGDRHSGDSPHCIGVPPHRPGAGDQRGLGGAAGRTYSCRAGPFSQM